MDWIIIALAGFFAGILNAVAGGGSFITLPALMLVGVPSVVANATGTAALLPGYIASAWRFRRDIDYPANLSFRAISVIAIVGGCVGAAILLVTDDALFTTLIPWLILFATASFVVGPWLIKRKVSAAGKAQQSTSAHIKPLTAALVFFSVCVYGGYFNGGLGIILLAALGLMGQTNLHGMNGLKNIVSALLTAIAVCVYAAGGLIVVEHLLLLGIMAILGGYAGAALAYRIPQKVLRLFIVMVGLCMAAAFFFGNISADQL